MAFAKLAKKAERYDEMVGYMDAVVDLSSELSMEEHQLLDEAYHSAIAGRLQRMYLIMDCQNQQLDCEKLEDEAAKLCEKILDVLVDKLIPRAVDELMHDILSERRKQFERLLWRCA